MSYTCNKENLLLRNLIVRLVDVLSLTQYKIVKAKYSNILIDLKES